MKTAAPTTSVSDETTSKSQNQSSAESILHTYKNGTAQLQSEDEEEPIQQKENKTGLPDNLKSGVENLSGHSLDDVKVHYNSSQPASLQAHAYAQGTDIHVAPGQEKHLPHEAWHVVQQKQGRVQPTKQLKGVTNINDDQGLEKEADMMGAKAMQLKSGPTNTSLQNTKSSGTPGDAIQFTTLINHTTADYSYWNHTNGAQENQTVGSTMEAFLDPDDEIQGSATGGPQKDFIGEVRRTFSNDNMIRGHLLNHDLGGFGVEQNLFPITSAANGEHLRTVEYAVKAALQKTYSDDDGEGVYYKVDVTGDYTDGGHDEEDDNYKDAPVSVFECTASYINDVDAHEIGAKILDVHVVSSPKKSGEKRAANLRGSAHDGTGGAVANKPRSAGAAPWKHGGRSGKLNFDDLITAGKITSAVRDLASIDSDDDLVAAQLFLDENYDEFADIAAQIIVAKHYDSFVQITEEDINALDDTDKMLFLEFVATLSKFIIEDDESDEL